jgi:primosomal protein N' (replication factor Y) (superfamily II helicase)
MNDTLATFARIILPLSLPKLYTYRVPQELESSVAVGKRVAVQFGARKVYAGIVHSIHHQPPLDYQAKYILDVLDELPLISPQLLKFWEWMASYYMCTMGDVMSAALPISFRLESTTNIQLNSETDITLLELSDKEYLIVEALTVQAELNMEELSDIVQQKNIFPLLKSLYLKEAILLSEELKEIYKPKTTTCIRLTPFYEQEENLSVLFDQLAKQTKQTDALLAYLQLKRDDLHIEKANLIRKSGASESSLKTLVKNGVFDEYKIQVDRLQSELIVPETFTLNEPQTNALTEIHQHFETKDTVLIHGVTSSGKTHVYVKLIEEVIAQGKQVLFLLPEIALTSQIVSRVQKYFGNKAASFHSKYSQNERVELWNKIQSGELQVIIGARSAVFLPFENLGLIIVDEEHESSYKQHEPAPRYNARDASMVLANIWACKTVLGSATPSFESYHNAKTERYGLVKMSQRFGDVEMPTLLTADIAEETRTKTMKGHFTSVLFSEITKALANHEQVILFQNRRGYAPILECQQCHWIPKCVNCDINLTYHKYMDSLKCHYCGYTQKVPKSCHACGSHLLDLKGLGTEKVEDELNIFFPNARVERLDLEATKSKHGHEQIIRSFENFEADILVGTQMISKGLDFEKVSVVGIINADQLLFFPDFRAHERAYQMLTQVSGRAGRKHKQGKVIIQTGVPNHHVIQEVIQQRYEFLFVNETEERKSFQYPPFYRLIKIVVKHKDYTLAHETAQHLRDLLYKRLGEHIIGPESPFVSRIRNQYIKEMLIKVDRNATYLGDLKKFIREQITQTHLEAAFKRVVIYVDVDPN